jgi:hypothetical protein
MLLGELVVPSRIAALPTCPVRKIPVPWFVAWPDGKPEFRMADGEKLTRAIRERLCWVCGEKLGRYLAFLIGPMCAINRISAEPPSHLECAEYSVVACPFLSKPQMSRRENDLPEGTCAGVMIRRNPGVSLVWVTRDYSLVRDGGGILFHVGELTSLSTWKEGRRATTDEVRESFDSGLLTLEKVAEEQGAGAVAELAEVVALARARLGI